MGLQLEDGKGRGFKASVSESHRLNASAKTADRPYYVSRDEKMAFTAVSVDPAAVAGDLIYYMKNTSTTRNIFINEIHLSAVESVLWKLWVVTGTGAGSVITSSNLNLTSGLPSETLVLGDAAVTGLTTVALIHLARQQGGSEAEFDFFGALILGPGDAIAVEYDTGTSGIAEVTTEFHFETIDRKN